ncbi:creatininase family protein [Amorphus orientalis]|uniref:Creatinine amidohydrolase n=1 Tax=Amorphus orientalis TaxID=649198 RepID=A0AAE3VLK8_9HYPH|nr:creatininase family protein [Amorphus orientalis]MDQ0313896.1 creatinine amidohydrolase [Amorphus orientalis]
MAHQPTPVPARYWADMTTETFAAAETSSWIAVLPVAAIEQHGPHLPVSTDAAIAEGVVARVVERLPDDLPVTMLPVQAIGKSNEHIASPGTLTLSWDTVIRAWIEIGESVHRAGVRKLLILNAHGGNVPLIDVVIRELRVRFGMLAVHTGWFRFATPEGVFDPEEAVYGIHGHDLETSVMLHLRPDQVRIDQARDFRSTQLDFIEEFDHLRAHGPTGFGWMAQDLHPSGAVGNAAAASAEKGRIALDHAAGGIIELLADMHRFDVTRLARVGPE